MKIIEKYFPLLSNKQYSQFEALDSLYHEWNRKINVISRKDIDNLFEHHVLHSLAISKFICFKQDSTILDFGTGGGFPGIPLAIMFPECKFKLIDGTGKKILVANEICKAIGLNNCNPEHIRGEEEKGKFDFVVSRAVMPLPNLIRIITKNISKEQHNAIPNGVICLKGGDIHEETKPYQKFLEAVELTKYFQEEWFNKKYCIYVPM